MTNVFSNSAEYRDKLLTQVRLEMLGPLHTDKDEVKNAHIPGDTGHTPDKQFSCGILYPQKLDYGIENNTPSEQSGELDTSHTVLTDDDLIKNDQYNKRINVSDQLENSDDTINLTNQHRQSSIAVTFKRKKISTNKTEVYFATYKKITKSDDNKVFYKREQHFEKITLKAGSLILKNTNEKLHIKTKIRKCPDDAEIITIALVNMSLQKGIHIDISQLFFQPEIIVTCEEGFLPIVHDQNTLQDEELKSNALIYRNKKVFCRGHGCAGDWSLSENDLQVCTKIFSNLFPEHEVRPIKPKTDVEGVDFSFSGNSLLEITDKEEARSLICKNLSNLCADYENWIDELRDIKIERVEFEKVIVKHIKNCTYTLERMRKGVEQLKSNDLSLKAFRIANKAMLMQQFHGSLKQENTIMRKLDYNIVGIFPNGFKRGWRPFQLAFVLMNLNSIALVADYDLSANEIVDLIWFPTGGGKTEAYLGVAAYVIALSRLIDPTTRNTEVLMRYTLRLLSAQQFERAATLIMALELLRKNGEFDNLNVESDLSITAGLWVGKSLTPNKFEEAKKEIMKMRKRDSADNKFQILRCPWCKSDFQKDSYSGYVINSKERNIEFKCHNKLCDYGDESLPISVIDEHLYLSPPTLLLGTVDKFAQLAWSTEPALFFGKNNKKPPSLIIQDELHLISGPLGSIVGHYEVLVQKICKKYGRIPKIIASTATIRRAAEQVRGLYDKTVTTFPPPGLNYDDSYFSIESKDSHSPGRRYVGVFAGSSNSHITAQVNLLSPLLQFPTSEFEDELIEQKEVTEAGEKIYKLPRDITKKAVDPYGTIVWYFNSLRELGYADTMVNSDISEYMKNLCFRYEIPFSLRKRFINSRELTSRAPDSDISKILAELELEWSPNSFKSLDILLATNMISVGVDIDRLGLMVITGQPKNTSEYIQASSRVGRQHPGLVFTLYNQSRSRDRSHFEMFKGYHQSLYRAVEPTSVTPFSFKARERALPGLLIGVARNIFELDSPKDLSDDLIEKIEFELQDYIDQVRRLTSSDEEADMVRGQIRKLLSIWKTRVDQTSELSWGSMGSEPKQDDLLIPTGQNADKFRDDKIEMMMNMRNVDVAAGAAIVPTSLEE